MDDIANKIFARLMLISTNDSFFSKNDLINIINREMVSDTGRKKNWNSIKKGLYVLAGFCMLYLSIYVSKESLVPMVCVIFSDVIIATIGALLKYSDIYFWKNLRRGREYYCSKKYGSQCRSIAVNIHKDGIFNRQEVYIENLLDEKIDYIEGVIKFFSGNTQKNQIPFKNIDLGIGREVKVDEISYNMDYGYSDKIYWDEVELHIDKIVSKDSRACAWSGTVIRFLRIYDFDKFNYWRLGEIKICPYEITWFRDEIVKKIYYCITGLLTADFGGYDRNNLLRKIKVVGFLRKILHRLQGSMLLCIIFVMFCGLIYGQLYWIINFIECLF